MASYDPIQEVFEIAKREFYKGLKNPNLCIELEKTTSIDEVYNAADKLQEEQAKRGHLRHLRKIEPYLERLRQYAGVIETFVQAKAEILSLLWGPIKLLLQMSSILKQSFDAIVNTMAKIGEKLPLFQAYTGLFSSNDHIKNVLCLFFKDILDFYLTALNFFSMKRWGYVFESVWPKHKSKIDLVANNIERHGLLMSDEVNQEHIREAHDARIKALDHYERTQGFQDREDFIAVETHISPGLYDSELDWLHRNICEGTGRWLQKEQAFCRWLDPADASTRLIWLQGIPGAGKTYLSSTIVDKARTMSLTLFAFLSYKHSSNTSTISILHSLIFQLVIEDKNLQSVLCNKFQSNRRDLKSNTGFARETLLTLLKCTGSTYIIIDGLDEIAELERQMTLRQFLDILKDCDETKLLISSRYEDDIARILKGDAQTIRVDHKNAGCIQAYITRRTQKWLSNFNFDEQACSEIRALLFPLAAKAKGLFLYARVVMENITTLYNLDSIQRELEVLPESLDEAYARVLKRIEDLQPTLREDARRVLGWIGCSPIPLTRHEIEQALCITPGQTKQLPQVHASLNIVQLCGPIVEIFDDHLQYLFNKQNNNFVSLMQANLDLATTCLTYLCSDLFDPDASDEDLEENILSGGYRLHGLAASQWPEFVRVCAIMLRNQPLPNDLITLLECFIIERENIEYEGPNKDIPEPDELNLFKKDWPKLHTMLCRALKFRRSDIGDWRLSEGKSWINLDPFTLSHSSVRMYEQLEALLCPGPGHAYNCHCSKLQRHYGAFLFKCGFLICFSRRLAFETKSLRDTHAKHHDRPCKCTVPTCDFAVIGFRSQSQYQEHWLQCHRNASPSKVQSFDDPDDEEIQPLFFDLVSMDRLNEVNSLLPRFRLLLKEVQLELIKAAAFAGSLAMVKLLIDSEIPSSEIWVETMVESIKGENIEILSWLISKIPNVGLYSSSVTRAVMNSDSAEVFKVWQKDLIKKHSGVWSSAKDIVASGGSNPMQEIRLAAHWKEQASLGQLNIEDLGAALKEVARTSCSTVLANALIESGANVNSRGANWSTSVTTLHCAARKTSAEAAELIKFLLLSGADPAISARIRGKDVNPSMERGARNISKWLGMTWDELVRWAQEERKKSSQNGESAVVER